MVTSICQDVISKGCDKGSNRDVPGMSWGLNSAGKDFQKIFMEIDVQTNLKYGTLNPKFFKIYSSLCIDSSFRVRC